MTEWGLRLPEKERPERGEGEAEGLAVPVGGERGGRRAAEVAAGRAGVLSGVAVEDFFPDSRGGSAEAVVRPRHGREIEDRQVAKLRQLKTERDGEKVKACLEDITDACRNQRNVMPPIIAAAKAYATVGEIVDAMKIIFGEWQESSVI